MSPEAPRDGLWRRALELAVLSAFAIAQPLFDLLGRNAEFFAVRDSPALDIVLFAVGLVVVPPLLLAGLEALAGLAGRRAQDIAHAVFTGVLGALIGIQIVKRLGTLPTAVELALALALGAALSWALVIRRNRVVRTFVTVLSPAPVLFLVLFLFVSPVNQLVPGDDVRVSTASAGPRPTAPVVMVVLDELPANSLLGRDGRIDRVRYPGFAALAARSTWYTRATTVFDSTTHAVPAILDGRRPRKGRLPTYAHHPQNLFTLLGDSHRMNVSEEATHLCPQRLCPDRVGAGLGRRMSSLLSDTAVVYAHVVLPTGLEDDVPAINRGWGGFAGGDAGDEVLALLGSGGRPARFEDWVRSIHPSARPALNFKHVLLPHVPWQYLPDGRRYSPADPDQRAATKEPFLVRQDYQRHLLQLGFTDRLIGRLVARLRETGLWDRALVVVTADHGVSFRVGRYDRRAVTPENVADIAPVPLFIKAPGQRSGRVSTRPVQTIDILPTMAADLGVRLPWKVDGRPADGGTFPRRPGADMVTRAWEPLRVSVADLARRRQAALDRQAGLFGAGDGPPGLYAGARHQDLLDRPVTALRPAPGGGASASIDAASALGDVEPGGVVPSQLTGSITGAGPGRHDLAVAVNGRVATVSQSFPWKGTERFSAMVPPEAFRAGRNRVEVLLVARSGPPRLLARGVGEGG
jgi:hypothetical protein